jgi:hypothetical protein
MTLPLTMLDELQCDNRRVRSDMRRAELFGLALARISNPAPAKPQDFDADEKGLLG